MHQLGDPVAMMAAFSFQMLWNTMNLQMWSKFNILLDVMNNIIIWGTGTSSS